MEESKILAEIAGGDTEKFGLLYDAYSARIYNYLFYRTHAREVAEDLASATFFKAIRSLHTFNARKGSFSAWIYRIARNTLYDHWRDDTRTESIDDHAEILISPDDIEHETFDRELIRKVNECVTRLPQAQQEIIKMRIWDDLPYATIAEILGKSEASCKMEFSRAIRKLKDVATLVALFILITAIAKQ